MHVLQAEKGVLIYPHQADVREEPPAWREGTLKGYGGEVGAYEFCIPKITESSQTNEKFKKFSEEIGGSEEKLSKFIRNGCVFS